MTKELSVGKALEKLRGSDEPKSRMTRLDEKNKALDEELRRLRAENRRLERDNPGTNAIEIGILIGQLSARLRCAKCGGQFTRSSRGEWKMC